MYKKIDYKNFKLKLEKKVEIVNLRLKQLLNIEDKNYSNFVQLIEILLEKFNKEYFLISHLNSVANTKETDEVWNSVLPIISKFYNEFNQNEEFYKAFKYVLKNDKKLNSYQERYLKETLRGFELSGIGLEESDKEEIRNINESLSKLQTEFSKNVLNDTKKFKVEITNPDDVKEFPESELKYHFKDGKWLFNLQYPSYSAYMKWGSNRKVRYKLYYNYIRRGIDNDITIEKILKLRNRKAEILGLNDYTELSLEFKIAENSDKVLDFLQNISEKSTPISVKDEKDLTNFAEKINHGKVEPWDRAYIIRKMKKELFNYDEDKIKQYFELNKTLKGMFNVLDNMFNLKFIEIKEETWDSSVKVFKVWKKYNYNNIYLGKIYFDLESRDNKRSGAWFNNYSTYWKYDGNINYGSGVIVANFQNSKKGKSYLTHSDVVTLFHEMGHALQHICSEVDDPTLSGINGIEWDGVEWSSQFLENLAYEKDVLKSFAINDNNEKIPNKYIKILKDLDKFRIGNYLNRQLEFSIFDMTIHKNVYSYKEISEILNKIRNDLKNKFTDFDKFQNGFSHIFSGGYAAGYYSYLFSQVMSIDSYLEFKNRGIFNKENCENWYDKFLKNGSKITSKEMFKNYMGRDINENSIFEFYGLNEKEVLAS